jgi:hypothetical protein
MYSQNYPITVVGSLDAAADTAACAMEGFSRLGKLLVAIEHFAALLGTPHLATLAKEGQALAAEYHSNASVDREQYVADKGETSRHG